MDYSEIISEIKKKLPDFNALSILQGYPDEIYIEVHTQIFKDTCLTLHKILASPIMSLFAVDERDKFNKLMVNCVFIDVKKSRWITVGTAIPKENPCFDSLAKDVHSATLFEREIWEMFGIEPKGNPDLRRLNLHDEVWPQGNYPLRKDFQGTRTGNLSEYKFNRVEGEGIFEVPVGPVHAGIIGPGHFRFSAAGEPIINLEIRLGFTHRGAEKLFEGKSLPEAIRLAECIAGDSAFAHSLAFTHAAEKLLAVTVPKQAVYLRAVFLELERIYNHVNDIGGMAIDVGFSFPAAYASIIKESILQLNEKLSASRYLKGINLIGGVSLNIAEDKKELLSASLRAINRDFKELDKILNSSVSFMDRVDTTGVLRKKTAEDLGITGLAGRASGVPIDLRQSFCPIYQEAKFRIAVEQTGDVLARLKTRIAEFKESSRLIEFFLDKLSLQKENYPKTQPKAGMALGYCEGWRGPVLYWLKADSAGLIERCKIVDPSFRNWQGLSYAALGNIIPDFPLCNKSFDLSYSGNDL
ncbi:MAG: NADH-quinone oxidoreductase subunit C [Candidatus Omnitrophota bacterium]